MGISMIRTRLAIFSGSQAWITSISMKSSTEASPFWSRMSARRSLTVVSGAALLTQRVRSKISISGLSRQVRPNSPSCRRQTTERGRWTG